MNLFQRNDSLIIMGAIMAMAIIVVTLIGFAYDHGKYFFYAPTQ